MVWDWFGMWSGSGLGVFLDTFVGQFLCNFGSFRDHFWVMLGLGGPAWGPLASFGGILGSTSDFDAIFDQIREKNYSILGPILGLFCVC